MPRCRWFVLLFTLISACTRDDDKSAVRCDEASACDASTPSSSTSCAQLRECCLDLIGASRAQCLVSAGDLEAQAGSGTSCQQAVEGLVEAGDCRVAGVRGPEGDDETCADQTDNDDDGDVDCADGDCRNETITVCPVPEDDALHCADGIDNDRNGRTDCEDEGCAEVTVDIGAGFVSPLCGAGEMTNASCQDHIDNDGDGYFDCVDYDCSRNPNVTVCATPPR